MYCGLALQISELHTLVHYTLMQVPNKSFKVTRHVKLLHNPVSLGLVFEHEDVHVHARSIPASY